jgi:acid phosphatase
MGSEIVFELYRSKTDSKPYIRVLWGGQPLKTSTPLGTLDMVSLDKFNEYIDGLLPANFVDVCKL